MRDRNKIRKLIRKTFISILYCYRGAGTTDEELLEEASRITGISKKILKKDLKDSCLNNERCPLCSASNRQGYLENATVEFVRKLLTMNGSRSRRYTVAKLREAGEDLLVDLLAKVALEVHGRGTNN